MFVNFLLLFKDLTIFQSFDGTTKILSKTRKLAALKFLGLGCQGLGIEENYSWYISNSSIKNKPRYVHYF